MPILQLKNISLDFAIAPILKNVDLQVEAKEAIFLVGRNGAGKSSLLKIINGTLTPDSGTIAQDPNLKIATLAQDLLAENTDTVYATVARGLDNIGMLLQEYHILSNSNSKPSNWLQDLEKLQLKIEQLNGWQYEQRIQAILSQLDLKPDLTLQTLSGGLRRRVALAQALVTEPNLLLLDEPTNHLDLENILWMEKYLSQFNGTIICISHDRAFVDKLATKIVELDRGSLHTYPGNLQSFFNLKEKRLNEEATTNKLFDKKLAAEEVWIRQGIKARRTRNEGRVRALEALRLEHKARAKLIDKPSFNFASSKLSSKLLIDADNISYSYANTDKPIVRNFSTRIFRGDRIGIIGPNGCGKSTLVKLLLGELIANSGKISIASNMQVAYYDQLRLNLDPKLSVMDNIAHGRSYINVNGVEKHVISYLQDFLFTPEKARTSIEKLSGGECNKVLLARLFSLPANVLVLDEPTNDLDIETLELLEDILINYQGTIILVSHDRAFMDNVVTEFFYFTEAGNVQRYIGNCNDALKNQQQANKKNLAPKVIKNNNTNYFSNKLSYKLQLELAQIPQEIENLENIIQELQLQISDPNFYNLDKTHINTTIAVLQETEQKLAKTFQRWEELD